MRFQVESIGLALLLAACSGANTVPARLPSTPTAAARPSAHSADALAHRGPSTALTLGTEAAVPSLALAPLARPDSRRVQQSDTQRQLRHLDKAIALYQQFLARAGDEPVYAPAVQRTRQRIEDLNATRVFLAGTPAPTP